MCYKLTIKYIFLPPLSVENKTSRLERGENTLHVLSVTHVSISCMHAPSSPIVTHSTIIELSFVHLLRNTQECTHTHMHTQQCTLDYMYKRCVCTCVQAHTHTHTQHPSIHPHAHVQINTNTTCTQKYFFKDRNKPLIHSFHTSFSGNYKVLSYNHFLETIGCCL